ncbi:ABC transporter permease [Caldisericum exile]|uniref:ABC transporter permease protein n=1 Tax=Caldisericum exile (strain DSM 21853 / NBRC 104410 / AZM16c01) TaxID=511051 RepID=A0A7U6GD40_CALEA|nr:ABC transporter permease [Caldisericum exile]BAL80218.1 putative ABC transporter permease protein [Caldisericum exile AZM16c01]
MRKILAVAFKDIKIRFRDVRFIFTVLLLPLLLIFFISSTFSFSYEPFEVNIAVLIEDNDLGKIFLNDVFKGEELKDIIIIKNVSSVDEGKKLLDEGDVSAFVYIDKDFSRKVYENEDAKIYVYGNPNESIKPNFVKEVSEIFALNVMRYRAILNGLVGVLSNRINDKSQISYEALNSFFKELSDALSKERTDLLKLNTQLATTRSISSFEYYSVGIGVMYIMFATNMFSEAFFEEMRYNTLYRLLTAPISKIQIFAGKVLGVFLMGFIEMLLIILFSYFVYGVRWGNILNLLIVSIITVFTFSSLSLLLASLTKSESEISSIGPIVALVFGFLGGSMWPLFLFPDFLKKLSMIIPNRWAINVYISLLYGDSFTYISKSLVILTIFGCVFLLLSLVNFSRRDYV